MHVDDFLATTPLPEIAVDTDEALAHTRRRGVRRRRRRAGVATAGLTGLVVLGAVGLLRNDRGDQADQVSTGSVQPSTTVTRPPTEPEPGDPATWRIDPDAIPTPDASTLHVLVERVVCPSGETGRVLRPGVVLDDTTISVTFTVEAETSGEAFVCQGNDEVPYTVDLGEPLGDRTLIDAICPTGGAKSGYGFVCPRDSLRWEPPTPPLRTVSGTLRMVGGPASAPPTPVPGTVYVYDPDEPWGKIIARTTADDAGRFTLQLSAGRYDLVAYSPNYQNGQRPCTPESALVVGDHDLPDVTVSCPMR